jgi:phosphatidylglycerol:prolipoprotein diacylglycerol transferase
MRRLLFHVFGFNIYAYPAFLYVGVVVGLIAGTYAASLRGLDPVRTLAALLLLVLPALVGSRLLFVAANWNTFRHDPRRIWQNSDGGASLYGGLILAFLVSVPLLSALALPPGAFCDAAAITLLIGMVFTRVGCLLNGCCAGRPAHGPFSLCLPNHNGVWRRRLPTQLLEGGLGALLLLGSVALWNYLPFDGALALANVAAYSIGRWGLELTREDASIDKIGSVSVNRVIAAGLTVLAAACWLYFGLLAPPPSRGTISAAEGADMPDLSWWYFLTAPLGVFAVLLLFRFVGCASILGLSDVIYFTRPDIKSQPSTTFTEGTQNNFIINASGSVPLTVSLSPSAANAPVPSWLALTPASTDGTLTNLSGTPPAGSGGMTFTFNINATNGVNPPPAMQQFKLFVSPPPTSLVPQITSPNPAVATFTEEQFQMFAVTAVAMGSPQIMLNYSNLPPWLIPANDNGLGMATLGGTPPLGSSSMSPYMFTITAHDTAGDSMPLNFILTVNPRTPPSYSDNILVDNPVAYWPLHETTPPTSPSGGTAVDLVGMSAMNPAGQNPGTYVQPSNPILASPPSPGANPPYLLLGKPALLANPLPTDHSIKIQGGCVQVPWAAALNPAVFTLEAVASPGWDLTQKGFFYSVLSSVGASAKTGFAVFAAPIGGYPQQPNSDYHWMLAVGNGNGFALLMPKDFTVNSMGVLTYTGTDPNRIGDPGPKVTAEPTYLAFTYDGTNYFLFIGTANRNQQWTTYQLVPPSPNYVPNTEQTNLFIGREDKTSPPLLYPFSGNLEEIAIYNSVLPTARIVSHGALAIMG